MSVAVTFDGVCDEYADDGTINVELVGERLFEDQGGNLTEMSEKDKIEFNDFITSLTPREAIEEALSTIAVAPAFDHLPVSEVDAPGVTSTVKFEELER